MDVLVPIAAGLASGALAGVPYVASLAYVRRRRPASIAPGCVALAVSIAVFALGVAAAWRLFPDSMAPFAFASAMMFLAVVIIGVAWFLGRGRH